MTQPLVSVGMPIRNGMPLLEHALDSITSQSYSDLEIVISDNNSTDGSWEFCEAIAEADPRIRLHKQEPAVGAWDNFRYVLDVARGDYFLWAAHDDIRSPNFIDELVSTLEKYPEAVLAFGNLVRLHGKSGEEKEVPQDFRFETQGLSSLQRMRMLAPAILPEIYGVFRKDVLKAYPWIDIDYAPDVPLLVYMSLRGEFLKAPTVTFFQWVGESEKTPEFRARANCYSELRRFRLVRLSWASAAAAIWALASGVAYRLVAFANIYATLRYSVLKTSTVRAFAALAQRFLATYQESTVKRRDGP